MWNQVSDMLKTPAGTIVQSLLYPCSGTIADPNYSCIPTCSTDPRNIARTSDLSLGRTDEEKLSCWQDTAYSTL